MTAANGGSKAGSPCATLFITVLHSDVNPKALIIQRVIKEHAVPADRKRC